MTLEELLAQRAQEQSAGQPVGPRINAQTNSVDLRPRPGETQEAYRARVDAARPFVRESPGTQQMNAFAEMAMSNQEPQRQVGVVEDVLRSGAAGIGRGLIGIATLPAAADNLIRTGLTNAGVMPSREDMIAQGLPQDVAAQVENNPLGPRAVLPVADNLVGGALTYDPQTTAGEYASTVGEFLPGGALARAPMVYGVVPGLASETAGQVTEGTSIEPWARLGAAVVTPAIAQAATAPFVNPGAISRALYGSGNPSAERQAAADLLERYGVPMTAGQRLGEESILRREMLTGPGRQIAEQQAEAFTGAILKTIGENATRATPEVLDAALTRIGQVFDDVQRGVSIPPQVLTAGQQGQTIVDRATAVATTYADSVASQSPIIGRIASEITEAASTGQPVAASTLMRWRSIVTGMTRSPDAATREAAIGMRELLDDGLSQTLTAANRTDDVARLQTAREQYRNLLAIIRAATGAGANTAEGLLSPSMMRSVVAGQDRAAYATGNRGEIADLARAGETILRRPNTSGTAENLQAMLPSGALTGIGATAIGGGLDLPMVAAGALGLGGAIAPAAYRRLGMTEGVQNALRTQGPPLLMPGYVNALAGFAAPQ